MDSITSIIISGLVYDLLKKGAELTFRQVFGGFYGNRINQNINIYNDFLTEINNEKDLINKEKVIQEALSNKKQYINIFEHDLYNTNFAKRLDYIMFIINQSRKNKKKINLEYLGEFLGFDSVNELLKYYKYEEEPTYSFCKEVADKLGVDSEWLKNGEIDENIFITSLPKINDAEKILENINRRDYEFHFVMSNNKNGREIIIVRKYNEIKYEYYPHTYIFNSNVGGGGRSSLLALYKFLKEIGTNCSEINNIHVVTEEMFDEILVGKEYCGVIEEYNAKKLLNILDDFLDVYHKYPISANYGDWYGDDFLEIQNIVVEELKKE